MNSCLPNPVLYSGPFHQAPLKSSQSYSRGSCWNMQANSGNFFDVVSFFFYQAKQVFSWVAKSGKEGISWSDSCSFVRDRPLQHFSAQRSASSE